MDQPVPMVDLPQQILILDPTIHYLKGCQFINKHFCIDYFLDWEGYHWVCI